jgi:hypothetical protein
VSSTIENINWVTDYVKCLGIYFGHNKAECKKLNIEKQLLKSEKIMNSWKKRNITMIGKIMIAKSLIIPNITYVALYLSMSIILSPPSK